MTENDGDGNPSEGGVAIEQQIKKAGILGAIVAYLLSNYKDIGILATGVSILFPAYQYVSEQDIRISEAAFQKFEQVQAAWAAIYSDEARTRCGGGISTGHIQALEFLTTQRISMSSITLSCAELAEVNLSGARLSEAHITQSDLSAARLEGANLRHANLTDSKFSRANLRKAELGGANFTNACLTGADFTGASFTDEDGRRADFTNACYDKGKSRGRPVGMIADGQDLADTLLECAPTSCPQEAAESETTEEETPAPAPAPASPPAAKSPAKQRSP